MCCGLLMLLEMRKFVVTMASHFLIVVCVRVLDCTLYDSECHVCQRVYMQLHRETTISCVCSIWRNISVVISELLGNPDCH